MVRLSLLAVAVASVTTVSALPHGWEGAHGWRGPRAGISAWLNLWGPGGDDSRGTKPTLPLNEVDNTGATPLPQPSTAVQYVLLGVGFQNYTCSAATNTWVQNVPVAGAIADLYDITQNVNANTKDSITQNVLKAFETCLQVTRCAPSAGNGYCDQCHTLAARSYRRSFVGEHFFDQVNGAQTPNFNIWSRGTFLSAKKVGAVPAPASAYKGANGLGAVAWLYLTTNGSPRTQGLTSVYRVETAGGTAPSSCSQPDAQLQVPYTAEYWFYN